METSTEFWNKGKRFPPKFTLYFKPIMYSKDKYF